MEFTRCLRCMKETASYPCPHCGYAPRAERPKDYILRPGTILKGKYVVGTILGQGGFGITYVGWDLALECKVAIKEYYPSGQVVRDSSTGSVLHWLSTPQSEAARDMGKEMFLKEARKMTRVRDIPQVVHVHDLFQENDTAYIIMDFVEGQTLKAHLSKPLTWEDAKKIFLPAIRAMEQVHQAGLIHRDLSPDNIMLLPNGDVRILDLGAAKDLTINSGASSMQVAKGGFSPLEQYTQRGGSGPWSDVYAMAATMYYSLTGVVPPPVMDRMEDDQLRWDLEPLKALPKPVLEALQKAMALLAKDRTRSMGEFLRQLEKATPAPGPTPNPIPSKPLLAAIAAVLVVALLAGWVLWPKQETVPQLESRPQAETQTETVPETETTVPTEPESVFPLAIQEQTISACSSHTVAIKRDGSVVSTAGSDYVGEVSAWTDIVAVSSEYSHTVGLKADGTVVAVGSNSSGRCNVSEWTDIVAISTGYSHTVGLKAGGTVVATKVTDSKKDYGQCEVSDWTNIVAICTGDDHTVGLKADGTVVATKVTDSEKDYGQCEVSDWTNIVAICTGNDHTVGLKANGTVVSTVYKYPKGTVVVHDYGQYNVSEWTDIVAISAGTYHTVGLKADGTVFAVGFNAYGQCDVTYWKDIVAISAGDYHTVGLKADGTVVSTKIDDYGQFNVSDWSDIRISQKAQTISVGYRHTVAVKEDGSVIATGKRNNGQCNISDWKDIAVISAGVSCTVGLKTDGTVVAVGSNNSGKCDVSEWTDIVAISTGNSHTVGLKADGTVVAVGSCSDGRCDVSEWTDIVAISAGKFQTVGLKADGTVVAVGSNSSGECDVSEWTDIVAISAGDYHTVGLKTDGTVVSTLSSPCSSWTDIVAISAGDYIVGLKSGGTVVSTAKYISNISDWRDIVAIDVCENDVVGLKADGTVVCARLYSETRDGAQCDVSGWTDIRIPGTTE